MATVEEKKFHFAIGKPWHPTDPNSSVGFYTYGSQIFYGTLNEAISARDDFNRKSKDSFFGPDDEARGGYRIYQLTEIPNSEHIFPTVMPTVKKPRAPRAPKRQFTDAQIKAAVESALTQSPNTKKLPPKKKKT